MTSTGWHHYFGGRANDNGDWGYLDARAWISSPTGSAYYCTTAGGGGASDQRLRCTEFTGQGFKKSSISAPTDWGNPG